MTGRERPDGFHGAADPAALWRAGEKLWEEAFGADFLTGVQQQFEQFGQAVASMLEAAPEERPEEALAAAVQGLSAELPEQLEREWFALPFVWGSGLFRLLDYSPLTPLQEFVDEQVGFSWQAPAVGPLRESIERVKALQHSERRARATADTLLRAYRGAVSLALERFALFLRRDEGEPITTLRGLYDAWVSVAEQAYRDTVMSADFRSSFAECANATVAVVRERREFLAKEFNYFGIAQQSVIDALVDKQAGLEAEIIALQRALAGLRPDGAEEASRAEPPVRRRAAARGKRSVEKQPQSKRAPGKTTRPRRSKHSEFDIGSIFEDPDA